MPGTPDDTVPTGPPLTVTRKVIQWMLWAGLTATPAPAVYGAAAVTLKPGDNIGKIAAAHPPGTVFQLKAGIYRQQSVEPKDRQRFVGQSGAILNGATIVTGWQRRKSLWSAPGPARRLAPSGHCEVAGDLCKQREDLFVDGVLYRRVGSRSEVAPGRWHDDGVSLFLTDDPHGRRVELSVTPTAFNGRAKEVHLENLIVEKYASRAQRGAIEILRARGWRLKNMTVRWNHGVGIRVGPGTRMLGGSYSHNGQLGVGGGFGKDIILDGVEIAFNNYAGYSWGWEAGGTKFVATDGLVVRNSCIHHNHGPGLWSDIDNINVQYANNKVFENTGEGIKHEISYKAVIRDNVVARNGSSHDNWLWGGQILVQNSRNVEVFGNTIEIARNFGNGLTILHQRRGRGRHGAWKSWNNTFADNLVIHLGGGGLNGMVADHEIDQFFKYSDNRFHGNTYVLPDRSRKFLVIRNRARSWRQVRELGFEETGRVHIEQRSALRLSCDRPAAP